MTLRKIAGLLVASGLAVGLIGGGVLAQFSDQVQALQNIAVGTFECRIVDATPGSEIAPDGASVTYTAPTIQSSAPGALPFWFSVRNTGGIPAALGVTTSSVSAPFSVIGYPFAGVALAPADAYTFHTGVEWTALSNDNLGSSGTVTWTVSCTDLETQTVSSAELAYGPTGWGGWSCPAGKPIVSATVTGGDVASLTLWRPGATAGGVSYPSTPMGYTYTPPEQGAIAQNDNDAGELITLVLTCGK